MRFSIVCKALAIAGVAATVAAATLEQGQAQERVRWKMHSAYGSNLPILGPSGVRIAEGVTRISEGRFEIKFYEPGALVPGIQYYDAVSQGSIDAAWGSAPFNVNKNPAYAFFGTMPFGPRAGEMLAWIRYGGGQELQDEMYGRDGVKGIPCGVIAPEASGWFRKEIKSVEDLRGLKMRFLGFGARVMEKFGVSTQLLAAGDIYPALELGTIDAAEFSMPVMDEGLGFYQVAKHYYFPGWHQQTSVNEVLVNLERYDALSDLNKFILDTVCGDTITWSLAEAEAKQFAAMKRIQEKGATVHLWPQEMLDQFEQAWQQVLAEETAKSEDMKRIYDSYSKFRADYAVWRDHGYLK